MTHHTTPSGRSNSLLVASTTSSSKPIATTPTQPKEISSITPTVPPSGEDDDSLLSKSLGHYNSVQGTNMPRGSYHDIKSRYFMSLKLASPPGQKTPPQQPNQQQTSPLSNQSNQPPSSTSTASSSLLTNSINRNQPTSSLSAQLQRSSPVQKQSQAPKRKEIDFYKHSEAIPIPSKLVANPIPTVADNSVMFSVDPSLMSATSLMNDDGTPMMFDGDFSFTDSSEGGSIDLTPLFLTNTSAPSPSDNPINTVPTSSKSGKQKKRSSLNKKVSINVETTTSALKIEDDEDRSPLTPNRQIIPPHLLNNRSDFSLYRQQQKHNTKMYKI